MRKTGPDEGEGRSSGQKKDGSPTFLWVFWFGFRSQEGKRQARQFRQQPKCTHFVLCKTNKDSQSCLGVLAGMLRRRPDIFAYVHQPFPTTAPHLIGLLFMGWEMTSIGFPLLTHSVAGTKDKRAVTTQRVCAYHVPPEKLEALNAKLWGTSTRFLPLLMSCQAIC